MGRALEFVVFAIDDELIDAVSLVIDLANVLDQVQEIRPLDPRRFAVVPKDGQKCLLVLGAQVSV